jgi:DNA-binding SARP family transcriptional activator
VHAIDNGVKHLPSRTGESEAAGLVRELSALREGISALSSLLLMRASEPPPVARDAPISDMSDGSPRQPAFVTYFGTFGVHVNGKRLTLGRNRAVSVLGRFLLSRPGRMVPRDELLELIWPDETSASVNTGHRLEVAVSMLRTLLTQSGCDRIPIEFEDNCYGVPAGAVVTDCDLFERYYDEGKLRLRQADEQRAEAALVSALELYRGDFLAEEPYADWTAQPRAYFADRRVTVLMLLCEQALRCDHAASLRDYALQVLSIDNLHELAHRQLIRAYERLGERGHAVRQYQSCADLLLRELGVMPSRLTRQLYDALKRDLDLPPET